MKTLGIILAAGHSSRLYPATFVNTKQLLPVYDKPLIYYPLCVLMQAGIRDFVIVTNANEQESFRRLLGEDQGNLGLSFSFLVQPAPLGIADAFNIVSKSMSQQLKSYDRVALILGDNIFYGDTLGVDLCWAALEKDYAVIFSKAVPNPEQFGVVTLDDDGQIATIVEKPKNPKNNLAVTGLYFYPMDVFERSRTLTPSQRGELEITDINNQYLTARKLTVRHLDKSTVWYDTGSPESLLDAAHYIWATQESRQELIGSPHALSYKLGWIGAQEIQHNATRCAKTRYGRYLLELLES